MVFPKFAAFNFSPYLLKFMCVINKTWEKLSHSTILVAAYQKLPTLQVSVVVSPTYFFCPPPPP